MPVQLRQLEYVAAIVDEKTMRKAAQKLYISEATISQQIQKLENELGLSLFERDKRTLDLSDAGQKLLPGLRTILQATRQFEQSADEIRNPASGRVRLGITPDAARTFVDSILSTFKKQHPKVIVEVRQSGSHKVREGINNHEVDLGIFMTSKRVDVPLKHLTVQPLARSEIVALASRHHPLAHRKNISKIQLVTGGIIGYSEDFLLSNLLQAAPGPQGEENIVCTTDNPVSALHLAQTGMGIAFVPCNMMEDRQMEALFRDLCILDLAKELRFPIQYVVAYPEQQHQSQPLKDLVRIIREGFPALPSAA